MIPEKTTPTSNIQTCDVLVIGSGGAGLRAAIELHDNDVDVLMVGKCEKREAHTKWAQGGINAALGTMDPEDSWQMHAADTIKDGGEINDSEAVEILCKNAPRAIEELDEWGCDFQKDEEGNIMQRFFGAATYRRACFVGDITGEAILNTLVDQVEKRNISFQSEVYIFSLLENNSVVNGALGLNMKTGEIITFHAKAIILATGGHSRMYKRSSSLFWENNGDGIALAAQVGASFRDMEMFQFHPTGMTFPEEAEGLLVTEAVRGEGGILTNSKGERFMERYAPESRELSARDVVARANYLEIEAGRGTEHGGVYLDISHRPKEYILERLPTMYERFKEYCGIDISKEKMEVAPTAHYSMGGVHADYATGQVFRDETRSNLVQNLYAIGEVVGGLHGGNRLGGNSLADILVFGRLVGEHLSNMIGNSDLLELDETVAEQKRADFLKQTEVTSGEDPLAVKKEIMQIMSQHVGVVRDEEKMKKALSELQKFHNIQLQTGSELTMNEKLVAAMDIQNMLPTCEMIIRSALMRTESRTAHYRRDYLETKPEWKKNIICVLGEDRVQLKTTAVKEPSQEVRMKMDEKREVSKALLE